MNINASRSLARSCLARFRFCTFTLVNYLNSWFSISEGPSPCTLSSRSPATSPRTHPSVIKMPLGLFTPRAVKAECWFCQQVNALPTSSQPVETAPLFPLEGTPNNFTCRFCGNRNLRDMVSTVSHVAAICGTFEPFRTS